MVSKHNEDTVNHMQVSSFCTENVSMTKNIFHGRKPEYSNIKVAFSL